MSVALMDGPMPEINEDDEDLSREENMSDSMLAIKRDKSSVSESLIKN